MLLVQLKEMKNFTNHEKDIANYILAHMEQIPDMSAGELAKSTLTSKATVVRLSQKLGLSGYHEFKLKLIAEVNQNERIGQILANEPITPHSSYTDIIHTLPGLYDKAITNTRLTLNKSDMLRIDRLLREAECIDIYATGISYTLAQAAAFKFATLGWRAPPMRASTATIWPHANTKRPSPLSSALRGPTARWKPWPNTCAPPPTTTWWASWAPTIK